MEKSHAESYFQAEVMTGKVFENNARINTFRNLTDKHMRISLPRLSIK